MYGLNNYKFDKTHPDVLEKRQLGFYDAMWRNGNEVALVHQKWPQRWPNLVVTLKWVSWVGKVGWRLDSRRCKILSEGKTALSCFQMYVFSLFSTLIFFCLFVCLFKSNLVICFREKKIENSPNSNMKRWIKITLMHMQRNCITTNVL